MWLGLASELRKRCVRKPRRCVASRNAFPACPPDRTAVLAVLAFLALRPGKGWLRRTGGAAKASAAAEAPGASGGDKGSDLEGEAGPPPPASKAEALQLDTFLSHDTDTFLPRGSGGGGGVPPALPAAPLAAQPPAAASRAELDTLLPHERATASQLQGAGAPGLALAPGPTSHALPPSYITTAGLGAHASDPLALPSTVAAASSAALSGPQTASRSPR